MGLFSKKTKIPATGYYAQPKAFQSLYTNALNATNQGLFNPDGTIKSDIFTPMAQTADESKAFDIFRSGMTPTNETLANDIGMFMNPYEDYVTGGINREAAGANSLVNQAMSRAGQIGSNRSFLGTSDVEQTRLNNIGQMRAQQYNSALDKALSVLPALKQQDASNLLGIGEFQRGLDTATKQAPLTGAQSALGMLNSVPTEFGNFGTEARTVKTGGGLGGILGSIGQIAGMVTGNPLISMASSALSGMGGGGGGFGFSTGGQGLFNGGFSNILRGAQGAYGPGF